MTKSEFDDWFVENIQTMAELGIYHYNSDKAKEIHVIMKILYPKIKSLGERVEALEKQNSDDRERLKENG